MPQKIFTGNGEVETLFTSYLYTAEGKLKASLLYGKESFVSVYDYKNGLISEIKQFKTKKDLQNETVEEFLIQSLLKEAGENVFIQKYDYKNFGTNQKLLSITDALGEVSLFEFDSYGNLKTQTNANGEAQSVSYTRGGRVVGEQSFYGGWYEYAYSIDGNLSRAGEKNEVAVKMQYYADGNIQSVTNRYGKTSYYDYNQKGLVCSVQSEVQKIWYEYDDFDRIVKIVAGATPDQNSALYFANYEYSEDGRRVSVLKGGKYKTDFELDAFGNVIKQIDGNGNIKRFEYDYKNQLETVFDAYENKTSYEYNALGTVESVKLAEGGTIKYQYNYMGQLEKIIDDCGLVYKADYDKVGRLIKEKSRADSEKSYEYDKTGRVTKVLCGGEVVESYSYGANGRSVTVKDGNGNEYLYNYDSFGRLINEKNRNALEQMYYYDVEGELKAKTDFAGTSTIIEYSLDRTVRTITYSDGSKNRFVYDAIGNIIEAENEYGKTEYKYDQAGFLVYQKDITSGEEIIFDYDAAGNRTLMESTNRQTLYYYGKNNEVKEVFDNKQRFGVKLKYNKNGQEVLREFGNGTKEETLYDAAGRTIVKMQKNARGELMWGEGYAYGEDGKRLATVDNCARVTLYEYNKKGQVSSVYYPYTAEIIKKLKAEADENGLSTLEDAGENQYLEGETLNKLVVVLNAMQYTLANRLTPLQAFVKESYVYDANGNRTAKTTRFGTINYVYDKENRLVSSGSRGQMFVNYSYDKMGNMVGVETSLKTTKYEYNAQNRLIFCEATDTLAKTYANTTYAYDAFGRRVFTQDQGQAALRTIYDGFSFDVVKQSPTFANGQFVDSYETGIRYGKTGKPTGGRYRYISDEEAKDNSRYVYIDEGTYKNTNSRYRGSRTQLCVNGSLAAGASADYGAQYFATDVLGSVCVATDSNGGTKQTYSYDVFGSLVAGELGGVYDFGYAGKQSDAAAALYDYGFRDYEPRVARFTTQDPIRDGANWYAYCNGDAVNFVDLWGLCAEDDGNSLFNYILSDIKIGWNQATNLDSGADYRELWLDDFKNGRYFSGTLHAYDAIIEYVYDAPVIASALIINAVDNLCQDTLGLGLPEIAMTLSANGLLLPASASLYYFSSWARATVGAYGSQAAITATNVGLGVLDQAAGMVGIQPATTYYPGSLNQPLPEGIANTFSGGTYTESVLASDTTFYRVWSTEENRIGRYMSRTPQNGNMQSQIDLALNPEWGNSARFVEEVLVPKGTTIYEGYAAKQIINGGTGELAGGGNQIFIKEVKESWFK